jgi:hypothetical protein
MFNLDHEVDHEGFSQIPPSFHTDPNNAMHSLGHLPYGKKTNLRSPGPPILDVNTAVRSPGPPTHHLKTGGRPPGLPTYQLHSAAHPPGLPTHRRHVGGHPSGLPTHRPHVGTHPPPSFGYDSNTVMYPPAFANDSDDDADFEAFPPVSVGVDPTNSIHPPFPSAFGTNMVSHSPTYFGGHSNIGMYPPPPPSHFY